MWFHQGALTEGEGSVQLTSLFSLVLISSFYTEIFLRFFTKQAILKRRSTVLSCKSSRVPSLLANTRQGWKLLTMTNTLTYHTVEITTLVKSFIVQASDKLKWQLMS